MPLDTPLQASASDALARVGCLNGGSVLEPVRVVSDVRNSRNRWRIQSSVRCGLPGCCRKRNNHCQLAANPRDCGDWGIHLIVVLQSPKFLWSNLTTPELDSGTTQPVPHTPSSCILRYDLSNPAQRGIYLPWRNLFRFTDSRKATWSRGEADHAQCLDLETLGGHVPCPTTCVMGMFCIGRGAPNTPPVLKNGCALPTK